MTKIGYVMSSIGLKDAENKETAIKTLVEKVFRDLVFEAGAGKPEFNRMMAELKGGDKLYVPSLSALSRSVRELLQIFDILAQKHVALVSLAEGLDTDNAYGKSTLNVIQALIELDRETMEEWKKDYIEAAKKRVVRGTGHGRK